MRYGLVKLKKCLAYKNKFIEKFFATPNADRFSGAPLINISISFGFTFCSGLSFKLVFNIIPYRLNEMC